jgi:hypothetical protein
MVELMRGKDGKRYPGDLPHTSAEHRRLVALSHSLRCVEHLTYPQMQQVLLERFGVKRSLGAVWKDVNVYKCPVCVPKPPAPPDPAQKARVYAWR